MHSPRYIDSHAHLNFEAFADDAEQVIEQTLSEHVWMINVGSQLSTSQRAVELAAHYPQGVYAAVGMHPTHIDEFTFDAEAFTSLAQHEKVVAIGEVGLDYFRMEQASSKSKQLALLQASVRMAELVEKPLIVHCRDAYADLYAYFQGLTGRPPAVLHCFVGTWAIGQQFLQLGFMLSFTGIITFSKDQELLEVLKQTPLERIMIETDAPYLTPLPHRGKRNEPLNTRFVAAKIAEIKGLSLQEVLRVTADNTIKFFNLH